MNYTKNSSPKGFPSPILDTGLLPMLLLSCELSSLLIYGKNITVLSEFSLVPELSGVYASPSPFPANVSVPRKECVISVINVKYIYHMMKIVSTSIEVNSHNMLLFFRDKMNSNLH